ncbi:MAG: PilZ domain-containing protein [Candidatus Omnitrophica bacterium]|nr:PilZ domain-containing protein [Candidatus Omnitrophota bacterium]
MWQGMNQRRFPRTKCQCKVRMKQQGHTFTISTVTENVGLGGVCVYLEKGLDIFSPVDLELILGDGKPPVKIQGTIVWVVRRREFKKGYCFDTGVEFAELSPEDKARLDSVIDKVSPPSFP